MKASRAPSLFMDSDEVLKSLLLSRRVGRGKNLHHVVLACSKVENFKTCFRFFIEGRLRLQEVDLNIMTVLMDISDGHS